MKKQNVSLIGMSNVGKSYWRDKIAVHGFVPFCCDDIIEKKLAPYLISKGFHGIEDVAKWMGQPYEPQFPKNQALYLKEERAAMEAVIGELQKGQKRFVVDTTGSVIYMEENILGALRELSTVVLLDAPESLQQELYRRYIANPKPVIWGYMYQPFLNEAPADALARCYPLLLKSRNEMYRRQAHITLDYNELRVPGFAAKNFLKKIGVLL